MIFLLLLSQELCYYIWLFFTLEPTSVPGSFTIKAIYSTYVTLAWEKVADAEQYRVGIIQSCISISSYWKPLRSWLDSWIIILFPKEHNWLHFLSANCKVSCLLLCNYNLMITIYSNRIICNSYMCMCLCLSNWFGILRRATVCQN